jgi:hypothetical protein
MYGLACVLLPSLSGSLQFELDRAVAAFQRGGIDDLPRSMLSFHDETEELKELFHTHLSVEPGSVRWTDLTANQTFHLDFQGLKEHLEACRLARFDGTLEELEPDFEKFAARFTTLKASDAETGRYGRWLNPLGRWDWWELGGRFNGVITGEPRPANAHQVINSGDSAGRAVLGNIARALGAEPSTTEAEIEQNVELVETLLGGFDGKPFVPMTLVLPLGCGPDAGRWFGTADWRPISEETRAILGAPEPMDYGALVQLAFERFRGHVAAGVAYHF